MDIKDVDIVKWNGCLYDRGVCMRELFMLCKFRLYFLRGCWRRKIICKFLCICDVIEIKLYLNFRLRF